MLTDKGKGSALHFCKTRFLAFLIVGITASFIAGSANADDKTIRIGSGGATGVYYPVAVAMCRLFNEENKGAGFGCSVERTLGSVDNLKKLREGTINFAIVQSDWQSHAYNGTSAFSDSQPFENLRSIMALYSESFTVLARKDANIKRFEDLSGRRVNIGNPGSGQRATMEIVMQAYGWTRFQFSRIGEFNSTLQAQALCDREVDAIIFVAGHPSGTIRSATQKCDTNLVKVEGSTIQKLLDDNKFYRQVTIPSRYYFASAEEVPTFGVNATLVTTAQASPETVSRFINSIVGNFDNFKKMHPALADLRLEEMIKNIMPAPMHEQAVSAFDKMPK